eukprot:UN02461
MFALYGTASVVAPTFGFFPSFAQLGETPILFALLQFSEGSFKTPDEPVALQLCRESRVGPKLF